MAVWWCLLLTACLILCRSTVQGDCPYPELPHTVVKYNEGNIGYTCWNGYNLNPDYRVENFCLGNKYWAFEHPRCERAACGRPPSMDTIGCYGDDHWCRGSPERYTESEYSFGDEVPFICELGYGIDGTYVTSLSLRCQEDGTWSQTQVECEEIHCQVPSYDPGRKPIIRHLYDNSWTEDYFYEFDEVTVRCSDNTTITGQEHVVTLMCMEGGEWNTREFPKCKADCQKTLQHGEWKCRQSHGYYNSGYSSCNGRRFKHNEERKANCNQKYENLEDESEYRIYQCNDGETAKKAECTPKRCSPCVGCTGRVKVNHTTTWNGSCRAGYKNKPQQIACEYGDWKPTDPCGKYCNLQKLRDKGLQFSTYSGNAEYIWEGERLDIRGCPSEKDLFKDSNYVKSGTGYTTCQGDNEWSANYNCFADCNTTLENGEWRCRSNGYSYSSCYGRRFKHEDERKAKCVQKYENLEDEGEGRRYNCRDGRIDKTATCTPKRCSPCVGCTGYGKVNHAATWNESCRAGYKAKPRTITCDFGNWIPNEPCGKFCNLQELRGKGLQFSTFSGNAEYIWKEERLNISGCSPGGDLFKTGSRDWIYVDAGAGSTQCQGDNSWSLNYKCFDRCPVPDTDHIDTRNQRDTIHGATLEYNCVAGYVPQHDGVQCNNGEFTFTPSCLEAPCPRCTGCHYSSRVESGREWKVECRTNYRNVSTYASCSLGEFNPLEPCTDKCERPALYHGSLVDAPTFPAQPGESLQYQCKDGYVKRNMVTPVCRNGYFDPQPACIKAPCEVCEGCDQRTPLDEGSSWPISCLDDYKSTDRTAKCTDSQWDPPTPCNKFCPIPGIDHSNSTDIDFILLNETITVSCDVDRKLLLRNGSLTLGREFRCKKHKNEVKLRPRMEGLQCHMSCLLEDIENGGWSGGAVGKIDHLDNEMYECSGDAKPVNSASSVQCKDGTLHPQPACVLPPCNLTDVTGLDTEQSVLNRDESLVIKCQDGYRQSSEDVEEIVCSSDGQLSEHSPCVKYCQLSQVNNAEQHDKDLQLGSATTIRCKPEYELWLAGESTNDTSTNMTCNDEGLLQPTHVPTCRNGAGCPRIENATHVVDGTLWTGCEIPSSDNVMVECITEFAGDSKNISMSCGQDGRWSHTLECQPRACDCPKEYPEVYCGDVGVVGNTGTVFPDCGGTNTKSTCNDGIWEPAVCSDVSIVRCGCVPPPHSQVYIHSVHWSPLSELVPVGEANITCVENGTHEETTTSVECLNTGQWAQQLDCILSSSCRLPQKERMTYRSNGEVVAADTEVQDGHSVIYSCEATHELSKNRIEVNTTCEEGKWTTDIQNCSSKLY